jgi:RNA polymerase sigma factor (sigma-70 family)
MPAALTKTIERLCSLPELTDGDLLSRFLQKEDAGAFEALLRRHGPLVLSVCRRILKNATDAEDAFQATFLVLLRTGRSIRKPESLASWFHGVARRTALHAKRAAARRRSKEAEVVPRETAGSQDLGEVLDEELAGLPEPYRAAILLCDLEGKTRKEAARELGCAEGTVASRLSRGRSLLAGRLTRRGITLAVALCPAVPAPLLASTLNLAAGAVSPVVAFLTQGVLKVMLLNKLKRVAGTLVLLAVLAAGTGFALSPGSRQAGGQEGRGDPAGRQAKEAVRPAAVQEVASVYRVNDASADERFTDKRVRVSGYMNQVKRVVGRAGRAPAYLLMLHGNPGDPPLVFEFPLKARKQLGGLGQNQGVTVEGQCEGRVEADGGGEVIRFRDCRLVAVDPLPAPGAMPGTMPGPGGRFPPGMRPPGGKLPGEGPMAPGKGGTPRP